MKLSKVEILKKKSLESEFDLSLRTYNVYADIFTNGYYVDSVWKRREKIPEYLVWKNRYEKLVKEMICAFPDVLCLQEVQPDSFLEFQETLKNHGYEGLMQKKKQYGNSIFYKASKYKLLFRNDRSRVLIVELQHIQSKKSVFVCNCHLEGHPLLPHVRFSQVKSMFKHVMKREGFINSPVIVCGDFNEDDSDGISHLLENGSVDSDFVFRNTDLKYTKSKYDLRLRNSKILKFRDSYKEAVGNDYSKMWTCQMEKTKVNVDFIFYRPEFMNLCSIMKLLDDNQDFSKIDIPSEKHPSDHFPLMSTFNFL